MENSVGKIIIIVLIIAIIAGGAVWFGTQNGLFNGIFGAFGTTESQDETEPTTPLEGTTSPEEMLTPSPNLKFEMSDDGNNFCITGIDDGDGVVIIPSTYDGIPVTKIDDDAFENCVNITSVMIPDTVTSIGSRAFLGCTELTDITIPSSVTHIGEMAFFFSGITNVTFGENSQLTSIGANVFCCSEKLKSIVIPNSVTKIDATAFSECISLTSVTIPNSVTIIGGSAFSGCGNLTNITIPNSVTTIGPSAFARCGSIESIIIPDSVIFIGDGAFRGCQMLTSVKLPDTMTSIGASMFEGCDSLKSIVIPNSVTKIDERAFEDCDQLTNITIPDTVTSIGYGAFQGCKKLIQKDKGVWYVDRWIIGCDNSVTSAELRANTIGIGTGAFNDCYNLMNVTIPNGVAIIDEFAFSGCRSLTGIVIPDSVVKIGSGAFGDCNSLTTLVVTEGNAVFYSKSNCIIEKASKTLTVGCNSSVIPNDGSVESIGSSAFRGCKNLTNLAIPDSIISVGGYAFLDCDALNYSTYDNAQYLGNANNPYLVLINVVSESISTCTIHKDTKVIYESAFRLCENLTSIVIPNGVTSIGEYAFYCCNLTSITIPDSVTSIGENAFYGCGNLTNITIPNSVTGIGSYAFAECGFANFAIPDSITEIAEGTFNLCGLSSVTIPSSITRIGGYAFYGCDNLTNITFSGTVSQWKSILFENEWHFMAPVTEVVCSDDVVPLN